MIPFNKPYLTGKEAHYMYRAVFNGHISGNGELTKSCQNYFQERWAFNKCLVTTSCTDALEMAAILTNVEPGDEVIIPSFTFVSTALAFVRQGAKIVFVDSKEDHPNMDETKVESLITPKTKVIVPVHYAGIACDMDVIMDIADRYKLFVVEDAAQAIDSYYKGKPLGSIGHLSCFSFHETKNIQCGEGGMLCINDERFMNRAETIWEKGTNRAEFFRGEVNKYGWVDTGSSFLPADYVAGFLLAQLEQMDEIQKKRIEIWNKYEYHFKRLKENINITLPNIPINTTNNAHMYYFICNNSSDRDGLIQYLKKNGVHAVFHYQSLHKSPFYLEEHDGRNLVFADMYSESLIRLPLYYDLADEEIEHIVSCINAYFKAN
ncbi:MAG: dTDP-4-amino-4,6-dideoxygalactose transaminase [Bacteroidales bacterium]|jgi:dTDP-4-amino-4,6-dideoxygalactose transaminase|nr:dTDP-4-amino-4,6-dideoxygalactose transaminase [Bacteroidales bacterium]